MLGPSSENDSSLLQKSWYIALKPLGRRYETVLSYEVHFPLGLLLGYQSLLLERVNIDQIL